MHAYTYHSYTHTHIHPYTRTRTNACTHVSRTQMHVHMYRDTNACTHVSRTQMHVHMYPNVFLIRVFLCVPNVFLMCSHAHVHTHTHMHTNACTHVPRNCTKCTNQCTVCMMQSSIWRSLYVCLNPTKLLRAGQGRRQRVCRCCPRSRTHRMPAGPVAAQHRHTLAPKLNPCLQDLSLRNTGI